MNINQYRMEKQYKQYYAAYNSGRRKEDDSRPSTYAKGLVSWSEYGINEKPKLSIVR